MTNTTTDRPVPSAGEPRLAIYLRTSRESAAASSPAHQHEACVSEVHRLGGTVVPPEPDDFDVDTSTATAAGDGAPSDD